MSKINVYLVLVLLLVTNGLAIELSGEPVTVMTVDECYDTIEIYNIHASHNDYSFEGCRRIQNGWSCPCIPELILNTHAEKNNTIKFSTQYYVSEPRPINPFDTSNMSQAHSYNQRITRVSRHSFEFVTDSETLERILEERKKQRQKLQAIVISSLIAGALLFFMFITFIIINLFYKEEFKRWLRLKEDEKITISKVFKNIFSRPNIKRKTFVADDKPEISGTLNKEQEQKELTPDEKVELEVQDLLKELEEDK